MGIDILARVCEQKHSGGNLIGNDYREGSRTNSILASVTEVPLEVRKTRLPGSKRLKANNRLSANNRLFTSGVRQSSFSSGSPRKRATSAMLWGGTTIVDLTILTHIAIDSLSSIGLPVR